jgi:hypothetical protein
MYPEAAVGATARDAETLLFRATNLTKFIIGHAPFCEQDRSCP